MKRILIPIVALLMLCPLGARALTVDFGNSLTRDASHTSKDVLLMAGGEVSLGGIYENDVIIAGGDISFTGGVVKGDILVTGGNVSITSAVDGNVRVIGGNVDISAQIKKNLTLIGGDLHMTDKTSVGGETLVMGGTFTMDGTLAQDLSFRGGSVTLNGTVLGNASLQLGDGCGGTDSCLTVGPRAHVEGNLEYWSDQEVAISSTSKIDGQTIRHPLQFSIDKNELADFWTFIRIIMLGSGLVLGILFVLLIPRVIKSAFATMSTQPGASLGVGALVAFAAPIGLLILMVTIIGWPVAFLLAGWFGFMLLLAKLVMAIYIGHLILRSAKKLPTNYSLGRGALVWSAIIGMLLVALVFDFLLGSWSGAFLFGAILGGIAKTLLILWAFGALVLNGWAWIRAQR